MTIQQGLGEDYIDKVDRVTNNPTEYEQLLKVVDAARRVVDIGLDKRYNQHYMDKSLRDLDEEARKLK